MGKLISVGLDVGTTTTQLILSELTVENRGNAFSVPEMEIANRQILYKGAVHFTPLLDKDRVDGTAIRELIAKEYAAAGITPQAYVDNVSAEIRRIWDLMGADYNHFIRTTDASHEKAVKGIFKRRLTLSAEI